MAEKRKLANKKLAQLPEMLKDILVDDAAVSQVKNQIYSYLCSIYDYEGNPTSFIEKVEEQLGNCIDPQFPAQTMYYVRKRKGLSQTYRDKTVDGIILDVTHRVMRTPSLVTDALLGQGEALDCYNQQLQDAAVEAAGLNNAAMELQNQSAETAITQSQERLDMDKEQWKQEKDRIVQAMAVIDAIIDPIEKAKMYKKLFTDCCDVPQSGGCGFNHSNEEQ